MAVSKSPVLLLGFNRPELAEHVFQAIRAYEPHQLFIAVDGARVEFAADIDKVSRMQAFASRVDWDCDVQTLFRTHNKGCQFAVEEAINWYFDHVERGIILEDDCVPHPSFFHFCDQMLERYDDDLRIMSISGESYPGSWLETCDASYSFSCYALIWGWATWRRAWKLHDSSMSTWHQNTENGWLERFFRRKSVYEYWLEKLSLTENNHGYTWDYQWVYSSWINSGLCVIPTKNLVTNIGCGADATHTMNGNWAMANRATESMSFPLLHPDCVRRDFLLDESLEAARLEINDDEADCELKSRSGNSLISRFVRGLRRLAESTRSL